MAEHKKFAKMTEAEQAELIAKATALGIFDAGDKFDAVDVPAPNAAGAASGGEIGDVDPDELALQQREEAIRLELIAVFFKHYMLLSDATEILSALNAVVADTSKRLTSDGCTFAEAFGNEEVMHVVLLRQLLEMTKQHVRELSRQETLNESGELGLQF